MMKISYLLCDPTPDLAELDRRMERIAALGYHGIELTATHPLGYSAEEIAALSRKHRLPIVSLLSGWSYAHEGLCLCSPDGDVRERAVERLRGYVDHAAKLSAIVVVGLMQGLRSDEPDETKANKRIVACLRQVVPAAEERGVTVVIEPVNHLQVGFNHTAAEVQALLEQVGSSALSYMLDTIHMNIEERSIVETIREHGRRIRHFHLCESNGGPLGHGNLDFRQVLASLGEVGYAHYISVKVYRKLNWDEAARSAITFLHEMGGKAFDRR
jgi:sugar phosphate isomerase/epimerase